MLTVIEVLVPLCARMQGMTGPTAGNGEAPRPARVGTVARMSFRYLALRSRVKRAARWRAAGSGIAMSTLPCGLPMAALAVPVASTLPFDRAEDERSDVGDYGCARPARARW